jgi:hypothetical protein
MMRLHVQEKFTADVACMQSSSGSKANYQHSMDNERRKSTELSCSVLFEHEHEIKHHAPWRFHAH